MKHDFESPTATPIPSLSLPIVRNGLACAFYDYYTTVTSILCDHVIACHESSAALNPDALSLPVQMTILDMAERLTEAVCTSIWKLPTSP